MSGHVVEEFTIGKTRIKICDDFCRDKTEADIEAIMQRIAINAQAALSYAESLKNSK